MIYSNVNRRLIGRPNLTACYTHYMACDIGQPYVKVVLTIKMVVSFSNYVLLLVIL